ncbi:MAG: SCO family protein [Bacillaceae bacterium]
MKKGYILAIVMVLTIILTACGPKIEGAYNLEVKNFTYTNQDGETFGSKDLKNKIWVADFVFTSCNTVCPPMTANLSKLKKMVEEKDLDVEFVSFSVDPDVDTPEKLKAFAKKYDEKMNNWNLLTGYTFDSIQTFAKDNFKTIVEKPEGEDQVIHGTSFYILEGNTLLKSYNGYTKVPFDEMMKDLEALTK